MDSLLDNLKPLKIYQPLSFTIEPLKDKNAIPILQKGCEVLENLGLKYWLSAGTLLGIHRDKKLIDHDTDIDIEIDN